MKVVWEWSAPCSDSYMTLSPGFYRLEVWGAQGGSYNSTLLGGKGGYAKGEVKFKTETKVYVNVGGTSTTTEGGCNGGGSVKIAKTAGGGGTDIRIKQNSFLSRIIVAGGGGGSGSEINEFGGFGGGLIGGDNTARNPDWNGKGGTENSSPTKCASGKSNCNAGTFGSGGASCTESICTGGGGGGWYGGGGSRHNDAGGGGSGFVFVSGASVPSGFLLDSSLYLSNTSLLGGDQSFPSFNSPTTNVVGWSGNGAARITLIESLKKVPGCTCKRRRNSCSLISLLLVSLFTSSIDKMFVPTTKYE